MSAWLFLLGNIVFGCLVAKVHKKRFIRTVFPVFILGLGRAGVSALGVWGMTFVFFAQGCRSFAQDRQRFCAKMPTSLRKGKWCCAECVLRSCSGFCRMELSDGLLMLLHPFFVFCLILYFICILLSCKS